LGRPRPRHLPLVPLPQVQLQRHLRLQRLQRHLRLRRLRCPRRQ
jgi:hypothetical protein